MSLAAIKRPFSFLGSLGGISPGFTVSQSTPTRSSPVESLAQTLSTATINPHLSPLSAFVSTSNNLPAVSTVALPPINVSLPENNINPPAAGNAFAMPPVTGPSAIPPATASAPQLAAGQYVHGPTGHILTMPPVTIPSVSSVGTGSTPQHLTQTGGVRKILNPKPRTPHKVQAKVQAPGKQAPISNNHFLLHTGRYSDFVIECFGARFNVHRSVLCPQVEFFAAACDGGFKESAEGIIRLPDDDTMAVWWMLEFLYTGTYTVPDNTAQIQDYKSQRPVTITSGNPTGLSIHNNIAVAHLAEKYNIPVLARLALRFLKAGLDGAFDVELLRGLSLASQQPETAISLEMSREVIRRSVFKEGFDIKFRECEGLQNEEGFWDILNAEPGMVETIMREALFQVGYFRHVAEKNAKAFLEVSPHHRELERIDAPRCSDCKTPSVSQYHPLAGLHTCRRCCANGEMLRI